MGGAGRVKKEESEDRSQKTEDKEEARYRSPQESTNTFPSRIVSCFSYPALKYYGVQVEWP